MGVSFNGSWPNHEAQATEALLFPVGGLTHHVPYHQAFNYRFGVSEIREGWNEIVPCNAAGQRKGGEEGPEGTVHIVCVELAVKKKGG